MTCASLCHCSIGWHAPGAPGKAVSPRQPPRRGRGTQLRTKVRPGGGQCARLGVAGAGRTRSHEHSRFAASAGPLSAGRRGRVIGGRVDMLTSRWLRHRFALLENPGRLCICGRTMLHRRAHIPTRRRQCESFPSSITNPLSIIWSRIVESLNGPVRATASRISSEPRHGVVKGLCWRFGASGACPTARR